MRLAENVIKPSGKSEAGTRGPARDAGKTSPGKLGTQDEQKHGGKRPGPLNAHQTQRQRQDAQQASQ